MRAVQLLALTYTRHSQATTLKMTVSHSEKTDHVYYI